MDVESCLVKSGTIPDKSRPFVFAAILLFSSVGILTNLFLLVLFVVQWKTLFRLQSYTAFVVNMIASGLLYSATNLWISAPCTLNQCPFIRTDAAMIVLATPNTLAHWGYLFSSLSFTIYRFIIFISKHFTEKRLCIKLLLIFPWMMSSLFTFASVSMRCFKRYNRYALSYTYDCSQCDISSGFSYTDVNFYAGQAIPLLMIIVYFFILGSIYRNRKANTTYSNGQTLFDAKLAFQFFIICFTQYLAAFLFYIVPKIGVGSIWGAVMINCIGTINISVNPTILLLYNQEIRTTALDVILCRKRKRIGTTRFVASRTGKQTSCIRSLC